MKTTGFIRIIIIFLLILTTVGCDQYSKHIVREKVMSYQDINLLHGHFTISRVENPGAFLSMGDQLSGPLRLILLTILPLAALLAALIYLIAKRDMHVLPLIAICFMIGGGIGNIYDRVVHGSVTDFLYIGFGFFHTGIFNVADLAVTTGFFILLIYSRMKRHETAETANESVDHSA